MAMVDNGQESIDLIVNLSQLEANSRRYSECQIVRAEPTPA